MDNYQSHLTGWTVTRSIVAELDVAVHYLFKDEFLEISSGEFGALYQIIPHEWRAELDEIGVFSSTSQSILEILAEMAGTIFVEEYGRATLAIREMDFTAALQRLQQAAMVYELQSDDSLPQPDRLVDLYTRLFRRKYEVLGVKVTSEYFAQADREFLAVLQVMHGQPMHDRFWHWLDRFFYEVYQPWRHTRLDLMDTLENKALLALGSRQNLEKIPDLSWLSPQTSIRQITDLRTVIEEGHVRVHFWVEPFGLSDSWTFLAGEVMVSFAEPGEILRNFNRVAGSLSTRAAALGDPTRLIILRLIRNFGMTNTDMAAFLGLSRPTVSIHAKILREAGLISSTTDGRSTRHEIQSDEVRKLFADLEKFLDLP